MQVKKFEAPTIQEALEQVKRELGPEAIILQTRKSKKGFGVLSKGAYEVTAAVSERNLQKKQVVETRLKETDQEKIKKIPAEKQADIYDKYMDRQMERIKNTQEKVELGLSAKKITATRYVDIQDDYQGKSGAMNKKPLSPTPPLSSSMPHGEGITPQTKQIEMEEEIRSLRKIIEEIRNSQKTDSESEIPLTLAKNFTGAQSLLGATSSLDQPTLQDAFDQLVMNGVDRRYALILVKKVAFELGPERIKLPEAVLDALASELMKGINVKCPLEGIEAKRAPLGRAPVVIALVGPTGVGKTMTIAKLASQAMLKRKLKVGLINLDSYKVGAFDQLATYAKILNLPFRSAATQEDLAAALMDLQSFDLVIVDTIGCSQRDPDSLKEIQSILGTISDLKSFVVLSATTRDVELCDAASRFSVFNPEGLIISKLDEATIFGPIYNLNQKIKLPLAYFTTGQKIPDDMEDASSERIAALIMNI